MSDEYLSGAALHRAIADAIDADESVDSFQTFTPGFNAKHRDATSWADLIEMEYEGFFVARKPYTRHLIDQSGKRWEWPEPLTRTPNMHDSYWLTFAESYWAHPKKWSAFGIEYTWLKEGRCHKTKEDRDAHERALIAASGGEVSDE